MARRRSGDAGDLTAYRRKRRFDRTPEPAGDESRSEAPGEKKKGAQGRDAGNRSARDRAAGSRARAARDEKAPGTATDGWCYVIHKHDASRLHFDLRLELDGVLVSWAVPKGPSLDPGEKHLAVRVEDHPLEYGEFEGVIPQGEYGGGTVMLWDRGRWEPEGDPRRSLQKGKLTFALHGDKLEGRWTLARMGGKAADGDKNWLLIKKRDEHAGAGRDIDAERPRSVLTGRTMDEIAGAADRVWSGAAGELETPAAAEIPDPANLPQARKGSLPRTFRPQLATLVKSPRRGDDWLHEIKFDGYRLLAFLERGQVRLITRNGKDWTHRFPSLAEALAELPADTALLDGEAAVVDEHGRTDFQSLQNALRAEGRPGGQSRQLVLFLFDLMHLDGQDLTRTPLVDRKRMLERLLAIGRSTVGPLRYSEHIRGSGEEVHDKACRLNLEGIVSKRADAVYEQKRSAGWVKIKCARRQELVVGGWLESDRRQGLRSLLLGYHDGEGRLVFAGKVGTGFTEASRASLGERLAGLERKTSPFRDPPREPAKRVHWVRPELVCEVEFTEWTTDGLLRHPSFKGLREDKPASEVVRETPAPAHPTGPTGSGGSGGPGGPERGADVTTPRALKTDVRLTSPDRVLFPGAGITKGELAVYYEDVGDLILPHVAHRPLTLVRCPEGHHKECFYQKHHTGTMPDAVHGVDVQEKAKERVYLTIEDLRGLLSLVQMGALELHPWGARNDRLDRPDLMFFDLDPGPDVALDQVAAAAQRIRDRLAGLGLRSFAKTSGGKGYHVVVPLVRRSGWDQVKGFAKALAEELTRESPDEFVAVMTKARRRGRVFVDYLRNSRGATSVAAFSTRAREGAPVSAPVSWDEVAAGVAPDAFRLDNLRQRLAAPRLDPWADYFEVRQSLTTAMRRELGAP
ncbi:MAG: DNA ligase D [Candidatus Krumholzibacteriia bacterium]